MLTLIDVIIFLVIFPLFVVVAGVSNWLLKKKNISDNLAVSLILITSILAMASVVALVDIFEKSTFGMGLVVAGTGMGLFSIVIGTFFAIHHISVLLDKVLENE